MKTLGGFAFIRFGVRYDYCFKESIISLCESCDKVAIVHPTHKDDGTSDILEQLEEKYDNLDVYTLSGRFWEDMKGKTKLANFQNIAAMLLNTDYQLLLQGDEILHEDSYRWVRRAVESGEEGFLCSRINLWGSPYMQLNVPQNRMPCSPQVIRLTKKGYFCYDDGESIAAPAIPNFIEHIRIYHMGFVRRKEVMKDKIINMQEAVFEIDHDKKLDGMDVFDWKAWFSESDLKPIGEPLPRIIRDWAMARE